MGANGSEPVQGQAVALELPPEPKSVRIIALRTSEGPVVIWGDDTPGTIHTCRLTPERAKRAGEELIKAAKQAESGLILVEGIGHGL